jgi:hypothetical protein
MEICFYYMNDWPMERFDFLDFPIGCDGEVGTSWGNLEHVNRGVKQEEIEEMLFDLV